jgi:two-component system, OmpR family, phosphate regulon sensor histidine kinase PhoR
MKKTTLLYIVTFMIVALTAIVVLQLRFLDEAYFLRSYIFDQTINSALTDVVKKVEKEEAINFIKTKVTTASEKSVHTANKKPSKKNNKKKKSSEGNYIYTRSGSGINGDLTTNVYSLVGDSLTLLTSNIVGNISDDQNKSRVKSYELSQKEHERLRIEHDKTMQELERHRIENERFKKENERFEKESEKYKTAHEIYRREADSVRIAIEKVRKNKALARLDSLNVVIMQSPLPGMKYLAVPPAPPVPPTYNYSFDLPYYNFSTPEPTPFDYGITVPPAPDMDHIGDFFEEVEKKNEGVKIFEELATEMHVMRLPLSKRVRPSTIDSLLKDELIKRKIFLTYQLKLNNNTNDSVYFISSSYYNIPQPANVYQTCLFEDKDSKENAVVSVYFPEKSSLLMNEMRPALLSSSLLFLMIVISLAYVLRSILKQKKLSEMKNDFINNMTHEFKTPVSTILLASEALKDPLVVKDESRLNRLAGIIYDENLRMSEHVERVLNMARMDREELKLVYNAVDLHHLIQQALNKMELQLNTKNTQVALKLEALNSSLYADEMHLKNIIFNLIDNANKYSGENTTITIETQNNRNGILLMIRDEGIGMGKDQMKKIFEPFYRVPTGNLHNVKGFGLGLHYVHSIIKKLNGTISVKSEPNNGTEFTIYLPFNLR